jgi:hypothetical protein
MTHDQVWRAEIASLREQASRRSGWVVCTPDAYLALIDFRESYRAAVRLDKLNGTNRAARFSPDALCLGRVCRNLDEFRTFDQDEAERLLGRMGWARELSGSWAAWDGLASSPKTASWLARSRRWWSAEPQPSSKSNN